MQFLLLTTGGTIAMSQKSVSSLSSFEADASYFARHLPLTEEDTLKLVNFSQLPSADFNSLYAQQLADFVQTGLEDNDGIVITHGTDTMEETAFYLELVLKSSSPTVLTGAMMTANQPGYEGMMNLQDAFKVVKSPASAGKGVLLVLNKDIISALHAIKSESERPNAFGSSQTGKLGAVNGEKVLYYFEPKKHITLANLNKGTSAIIKLHYDIEAEFLEFAFTHFDIVILECLGSGRVPPRLFPMIQAYSQETMTILTTRAFSGHLYDNYDTAGSYHSFLNERVIISALNSLKSSILAKLCLGNQKSYSDIKEIFENFWN
jgi:L-asparaginase